MCLPDLLGLPPLYLHTASNQILDLGTSRTMYSTFHTPHIHTHHTTYPHPLYHIPTPTHKRWLYIWAFCHYRVAKQGTTYQPCHKPPTPHHTPHPQQTRKNTHWQTEQELNIIICMCILIFPFCINLCSARYKSAYGSASHLGESDSALCGSTLNIHFHVHQVVSDKPDTDTSWQSCLSAGLQSPAPSPQIGCQIP